LATLTLPGATFHPRNATAAQALPSAGQCARIQANVTEPVNAGKGRVVGLEIGGQYAFDDSILRGFGVAANYTLSQSTSDQATEFSSHSSIPGVAQRRPSREQAGPSAAVLAPATSGV